MFHGWPATYVLLCLEQVMRKPCILDSFLCPLFHVWWVPDYGYGVGIHSYDFALALSWLHSAFLVFGGDHVAEFSVVISIALHGF